MAKNTVNNYVWLLDTIYRAKRITMDEINERWVDQGMDEKPIPKRTFHKWREAAEDLFNLNIECDRHHGYQFYIEDAEEIERGGLRKWLLDTLTVSNLLLKSQSLKDRILLEIVPSGQDHLPIILDAMKVNKPLQITYKSFYQDEASSFEVHPYCVKLFKQRWYMVAFSPYIKKVLVYGVDRILDIHELDRKKFSMPADFEPSEFFKYYYGIIAGTEGAVETVKLKVSAWHANYLRSLPLHKTQEEVETNDEYSIFTLRICPEFDFQQEILRNGEDLEVMEPQWLRDVIAEKTELMAGKYKKGQKQ